MSENNTIQDNDSETKLDWKSLLRRKDRPLPKAGCSWLFYIVLLLIFAYLTIMYIKYKNL